SGETDAHFVGVGHEVSLEMICGIAAARQSGELGYTSVMVNSGSKESLRASQLTGNTILFLRVNFMEIAATVRAFCTTIMRRKVPNCGGAGPSAPTITYCSGKEPTVIVFPTKVEAAMASNIFCRVTSAKCPAKCIFSFS